MNATADARDIRINAGRLWASLMEMAKIGATPKGGVKRLTLTDLDRQGRELFVALVQEAGLTVERGRRRQHFRAARRTQTTRCRRWSSGSHLDTQPSGGKFDGATA